jgi:hypothetical protein
VIDFLIRTELEIEINRVNIPYDGSILFKNIDTKNRQFIDEVDLRIFFEANDIYPRSFDLKMLIIRYNGCDGIITKDNFIKALQ